MTATRFNLAAVVITAATALASPGADDREGFEPLFNGKDLSGWQVNEGGNMKCWGAENGVLYVTGGGGGWLMTEKEYGDFIMELEYKVPKHGNSGVALRSPMKGDPAYVGMEVQILDDPNWKNLRPTQFTGSIYDIIGPSKQATKPCGEWNKMRIAAKGRQVTVELNGAKIVDANLDEYKDQAAKHPGILRDKGHLGLQSHDGRVEFRKLYVKPL